MFVFLGRVLAIIIFCCGTLLYGCLLSEAWAVADEAYCVEDNVYACKQLGYTKSSCVTNGFDAGGVACPYDPTLWYCAKWTCADGRYQTKDDTNYWSSCIEQSYKGLNCYDCTCETTSTACAIGDVFYEDGTCSSRYASCIGKLPIGVVYMLTDVDGNSIVNPDDPTDITSKYGRIISLTDVSIKDYEFSLATSGTTTSLLWGAYGVTQGLDNFNWDNKLEDGELSFSATIQKYIGQEGTSPLYAGTENTLTINNFYDKATASGCAYTKGTQDWATYCYPVAAKAAAAYYPYDLSSSDASYGASHWYLPAVGELMELYGFDAKAAASDASSGGKTGKVRQLVDATLQDMKNSGIKATTLSNGYYHSSTMRNSQYDWVVRMYDGARSHMKKSQEAPVRASLKFNNADFEPVRCSMGDVYYSDGTCSSAEKYDSSDSSKTPIGVVFMLTSSSGNITDASSSAYGRIVSLANLTLDAKTYLFNPQSPFSTGQGTMYWGLSGTEIKTLPFYVSSDVADLLQQAVGSEGSSDLYDGRHNTWQISKKRGTDAGCLNGTFKQNTASYAQYCLPTSAMAALQFYPTDVLQYDSTYGAGNWYLPSIGELSYLYHRPGETGSTVKTLVSDTLKVLAKNKSTGATALGNANHRSSTLSATEKGTQEQVTTVLGYNFSESSPQYINSNRTATAYTRPVLEFRHSYCGSAYNLSECPSGGSCSSCADGKLMYRLDSCNKGYTMSDDGHDCISSSCEIGDIYYADGSCNAVEQYDGTKTPVGIVYMLTDENEQLVSTPSDHGRVIALNRLAVSTPSYAFDPENPYTGDPAKIYWGLYGTDTSLTNYNSLEALSSAVIEAGDNAAADIYNGQKNTEIIANTALKNNSYTKYTPCTDGTYTEDSATYLQYCIPTAARFVLRYYPAGLKDNASYGAGNWYLMSYGELLRLYGIEITNGTINYTGRTYQAVDTTLKALAALGLRSELGSTEDKGLGKSQNSLSSTESAYTTSATFNLVTQTTVISKKDTGSHPVWPSLKF